MRAQHQSRRYFTWAKDTYGQYRHPLH
jgi:hypothetical protein